MALKAGYVGVKKSMLGLINKLAASKLIKTIGDGLTLTAAGTLKASIDTETMEFKSGKLASKGGSKFEVIFSTESASGETIEVSEDVTNYKLLMFESWDNNYKATALVSCLDIVKGTSEVPGVSFGKKDF